MSAVGSIQCGAIAALQPGFPALMSKIVNCDPGAVQRNAQAQMAVMARAGEVCATIEMSMKRLEALWKAGAAAADAVKMFDQLRSSFDELVGQGADLGKRIQAAGQLLQTTIRIVQFVRTANAAVAALMSNPFSMSAARALAAAATAQTASWLAMLAQTIMTVGQAISAIQQATQRTETTTDAIGRALEPDLITTQPVGPPVYIGQPGTLPGQPGTSPSQPGSLPGQPGYGQPAYGQYPAYGSYPAAPAPLPAPLPAPGTQVPAPTRVPNVYNSGWIPRGTGSGSGGSGDRITVRLEDPDGDGKYNVEVDAEGKLDKDLTIGGKIGDQEFNLNIDV